MAVGAELAKRAFLGDIQPQLFPNGSFMAKAIRDDEYVNVNTVELPHSGSLPSVAIDRSSVPAPISQRTDVATNYKMREFTTDPTLLQLSEELIVNYNKRQSVMSQHTGKIKEIQGTYALQQWISGCDALHTVFTTGATRATYSPGGVLTGTRKALTIADIAKIKGIFMTDNVLLENGAVTRGVAVLPQSLYTDLLLLPQFTQYLQSGSTTPLLEGSVARVFGFDIFVRDQVAYLANGQTAGSAIKQLGNLGQPITLAATDQPVGVFYSADYVRLAMGSAEVFVNPRQAAYYGDLISMLMRFGAIQARNDSKGVIAVIESN